MDKLSCEDGHLNISDLYEELLDHANVQFRRIIATSGTIGDHFSKTIILHPHWQENRWLGCYRKFLQNQNWFITNIRLIVHFIQLRSKLCKWIVTGKLQNIKRNRMIMHELVLHKGTNRHQHIIVNETDADIGIHLDTVSDIKLISSISQKFPENLVLCKR